jgi:hypothetical protein
MENDPDFERAVAVAVAKESAEDLMFARKLKRNTRDELPAQALHWQRSVRIEWDS